jgi:hypothetical protein
MNHKQSGIQRRVSECVYPKDLLSERTLLFAPPDVKGAWVWCLLVMWDEGSDRVIGTYEELGRLWGCDAAEAKQLVGEIKTREIASVTFRHSNVTLMSRRLSRRKKERESAKNRKQAQRERERHGPVTAKKRASSSSSSISSSSSGVNTHRQRGGGSVDFQSPSGIVSGGLLTPATIHSPKFTALEIAFAITGEDPKSKSGKMAAVYYGKGIYKLGDKTFRELLVELSSEMTSENIKKPGAILTNKLKKRGVK